MDKFKAIVFLGVSVVVVGATLVLILMNLGDRWNLHLFWQTVEPR